MTRTACLPSHGEQTPEAGGLLATTFGAVMASTSRSSSLEKEAVCCPASFRFVFPGRVCLCRERTKLVRCALLVPSTQNKHSRGRWYDNREHLERGREKGGKQGRSWVSAGTPPPLLAEAERFPIARNKMCARIP
jgi:hypothetical protein